MAADLCYKDSILNPILRLILIGAYDDNSPFFKLQGIGHILQRIWTNVKELWRKQIQYCEIFDSAFSDAFSNREKRMVQRCVNMEERTKEYLHMCRSPTTTLFPPTNPILFPPPKDININMMPFKLSDAFKDTELPNHLKDYWDHIISLCRISKDEIGKIGFLTIQESHVSENESQRRPGIHVETPENVEISLKTHCSDISCNLRYFVDNYFTWESGFTQNYTELTLKGGIYMASTVGDSCRIWNCRIIAEENGDEIIGHLGDVEHLRELMNDYENIKPNHIYWLTDRTPHESLPLAKGTYGQFFRLFMSNVSGWYEDHSTKNLLGVEPDQKQRLS